MKKRRKNILPFRHYATRAYLNELRTEDKTKTKATSPQEVSTSSTPRSVASIWDTKVS